jgi:hypothetical protein
MMSEMQAINYELKDIAIKRVRPTSGRARYPAD